MGGLLCACVCACMSACLCVVCPRANVWDQIHHIFDFGRLDLLICIHRAVQVWSCRLHKKAFFRILGIHLIGPHQVSKRLNVVGICPWFHASQMGLSIAVLPNPSWKIDRSRNNWILSAKSNSCLAPAGFRKYSLIPVSTERLSRQL